ncbi:MAG TPA: lytic transglycosylase domain-containing protein [Miltoncostaeaceae bacterium]|nr:lytic transglycosylase domain-containing protein [Miltoncostaeaceae bacterium]
MRAAGIEQATARIAEIQARLSAFGMRPAGGVVGAAGAAAPTFQAELATATTAGPDATPSRAPMAVRTPLAPPGGVAPDWAAGLPERGAAWAPAITAAAERHGLDPRLLAALVWAESGFDPGVESHAGALGLAQLMPGTAAGLGVDPHDPAQNLEGGARYLRAQLDRFGSVELALAAYNAGPGRVVEAGGIPRIAETQAYVPRVLGYYDRLKGTT